jgi:starch phosphorylase
VWYTSPEEGFKKLNDFVNDEKLLNDVEAVKRIRKVALANYIKEHEGVEINPDSIFDIQVKRLHAYKRQLLNALHIMYLYNKLKEDVSFRENFHPQTFIFGAKAAPGYAFAKNVIKLINTISEKVNNDSEINEKLKVVFVENYNVSYAELIMPAADVSEQISTAGKEASGTGNMKFMMNGALTVGTMDGANVEIHDLVGSDNIYVFGMTKDEVAGLKESGTYNSKDYYTYDARIAKVVDQLVNGFFDTVHADEFRMIYDELINHNDEYYLLKDFASYVDAQARINEDYKDRAKWNKMALINIAESGFFSTDRTIEDYVTDIWKLDKLDI